MLSGGALDASAADGQAVHFGVVQENALLLGIFLDKAVSRFVRDRADGAGFEYVVTSEQLLRVAVGARLVLAGEIQVDIRRFVAVKAEERLERDVVTVLQELLTAFRAFLVGHVKA